MGGFGRKARKASARVFPSRCRFGKHRLARAQRSWTAVAASTEAADRSVLVFGAETTALALLERALQGL